MMIMVIIIMVMMMANVRVVMIHCVFGDAS